MSGWGRLFALALPVLARHLPAAAAAEETELHGRVEFSGSSAATPLTLRHYAPAPGAPAPYPAAILIHGGELLAGSKDDADVVMMAAILSSAGYAVFAIDYRLAPIHPYPAAFDDVRRAIRFVRFHASGGWRVDSRRIALVGLDAGALLANLAAVWPGAADRQADDPVSRQSAEVQAVVSVAGFSDLRGGGGGDSLPAGYQTFLAPMVVRQGLDPTLAEASPAMHIHAGAPPFLLIHGDADRAVPVVQSTHWQNALQAAGVACNLILIPGGGHDAGQWPAVRNWRAEMLDWLEAALSSTRR